MVALILGTGAGYLEPEFRALGGDFDARNERLDDAIDLMKQVWTGDTVDASGPGFEAHGHVALPTPVQVPHPPIWIGGNSRRALRRVAERGDGWIPMPAPKKFAKAVRSAPLESIDDLSRMLDTIREEAEEVGRTMPTDVMFGPMGLPPYGAPGFDVTAYLDQVSALTRLGVTSAGVMFSHPGQGTVTSRAEFLALAAGFASEVGILRHADERHRGRRRGPALAGRHRGRGQPTSDSLPFTLLKWLVQV